MSAAPVPKFLPFPRRPPLLAIDDEAKTVTRYLPREPGAGGGFLVDTAHVNPPETMDVLGQSEARQMLETFRATGRVK